MKKAFLVRKKDVTFPHWVDSSMPIITYLRPTLMSATNNHAHKERGLEYSISLKSGTKIIIQKTQPLLNFIFATIKYSLYGCVPLFTVFAVPIMVWRIHIL